MIYIVTALKPEAQAFVDFFKLKKSKLQNYTLFTNENIHLIISGMGVDSARMATQTLINNFDITDDDIFVNIGICGASKEYAIGELILCGTIFYQEIPYTFKKEAKSIYCSDKPLTESTYSLVDMESFGFYDAIDHNPAIKKFYIIKIVSDHFEPKKVTKELAKSLIFNQIDAINKILNTQETL